MENSSPLYKGYGIEEGKAGDEYEEKPLVTPKMHDDDAILSVGIYHDANDTGSSAAGKRGNRPPDFGDFYFFSGSYFKYW